MKIEDFKIQWFPGHMTKAKRMMESQIKLVDVVVEMLDARIPRSSTNPMLIDVLGNKPKVIALNKTDMADNAKTELWMQKLKNSGLPVCKVDCATGKGVKQLISMIQVAAKPVLDKWLKKGVRNRSVRVMIVGIPNVGKSTLINRLVGKNKVVAADKPGVTRGQQWVTIAKGLELLDTPGVLWPKFEDPEVGMMLAYTGAVKEGVIDIEELACKLMELLHKYYPEALKERYGIEITDEATGYELLQSAGKKRGYLLSRGEIHTERMAKVLLDEYRSGKLGKFTLEMPEDL